MIKRCTQCGFDAAPEHFKGNLCSMCADPVCAIEAIGHLHHVYDRFKTMVRYRQRVMTLDAFYAERKALNKASKKYRDKVKDSEFQVIAPVWRVTAKRGVKSARLCGT